MSFEDREMRCVECGATFTFSAGEQEFFQSKGYTNEPKRCPACREARRAQRYGGNGDSRSPRQMYPVICAACGKETEVPFEPRQGRPVYCSDCFSKMKANPNR
jgi:CxxC-x17-CxxC domain-containing protein